MIDRPSIRAALALSALVLLLGSSVATAKQFSAWGSPVPEVGINTGAAEGCPIESPRGDQLFFASNRAGSVGNPDPNDIWVATRSKVGAAWSTPVNLGVPVNSTAADFCPTPLPGHRLLFVSNRANPHACGSAPAGDIYLTRWNPAHGWAEPTHLGCDADGSGPNFPGAEFGPSLVETAEGTFLYFSSNGYGGDQNIYVSRQRPDGSFGRARVVTELSTGAEDLMPNVRRDGLEIVFNSNRTGGAGGQDVYTSHRATTADPWSTPMNVSSVNTDGNETRSSLSGDGQRLHFGRDGDIYVSVRTKTTGHG
jgi:WD40-like Beta Propeller Repeat